MTIHIEDLKFKCIVGILDFERKKPQDVIVNVIINYDYTDEYIDYSKVVNIIKKNMKKKKYLLLEDALEGLRKKIFKNFPLIETLELKLTKPSILPDCRVSLSQYYT